MKKLFYIQSVWDSGLPIFQQAAIGCRVFDLPQDKATYKGTFKVPAHFQAASNGLLKEIRGTTDGAKEYVWEHNFPSATYMLTFAAGPYQLLDYKDYKNQYNFFHF